MAQHPAGSGTFRSPGPAPAGTLAAEEGGRWGAAREALGTGEASSRGHPGLWILCLGREWALVLSCKLWTEAWGPQQGPGVLGSALTPGF